MPHQHSYVAIFHGQFFVQMSKNEHFNGKSISLTEVMKLYNISPLIPVLKTTQKINKIQRVSWSPSETMITES